jgi:enterochelin esterase-like enzyme
LVNNILDNAINAGKVSPMLVVLDNINAYKRINGKLSLPNLIDSVINSELVSYIDNHYHTIDSAKYRAIAGCSSGGKLAMNVAIQHNNRFGNVGMFTLTSDFDTSKVMVNSIVHSNFKLIFLGTGLSDSTYIRTLGFRQLLTFKPVTLNWDVQNGANNWLTWRKNLYAMIKGLFK